MTGATRCPECGAVVLEEQYCPVHRMCWECDDACFPDGGEEGGE